MPLDRRRFLLSSTASAALGAAGWPRLARAGGSTDRNFVFVVNYGGWDPTRVFATEFGNPQVDMERDAERATLGDLSYVDHPDRPAVRAFFEAHHARTAILNGILVPSVAHENCMHLSMTGTTVGTASDWPAILAGARVSDFALPHLIIDGPSYPGRLGGVATRTGSSGQLEALLSGDVIDWSDVTTSAPSGRTEDLVDAYMARRLGAAAAAARSSREAALASAYQESLARASYLKGLQGVIDWSAGTAFSSQVGLAVDALALGICRAATLSFAEVSWDSHEDNDSAQSQNFESLFSGLGDLLRQLESRPGRVSDTLADETVVVVLSEMGRTPQLNDGAGKDHWPYTSTMIVGPGITGGRVVGAFDAFYYGERVDLESGELASDGNDLSTDVVGATLLKLGGVDPAEWLPGVSTVDGLLG